MSKHNEIQYGLGCPNAFGLKSTDCTVNCKQCWKQAIKDIKFKEDQQ